MPTTRTIHCPACQTSLELDEETFQKFVGQDVQCAACQHSFRLAAPAPAPGKLRIRLHTATLTEPPSSAAPAAACPTCGAGVAADAVICVACGTNLQTGKKVVTKVSATGGGFRRVVRAVVGVVAIAVIVGSLYSMYARHRQEQVEAQTRTLSSTTALVANSTQFEKSVHMLEEALTRNPRALGRDNAESALRRLQAELAQVPARSRAVDDAITQAHASTNRLEAMQILQTALIKNPGATNEAAARAVIAQLQKAPAKK